LGAYTHGYGYTHGCSGRIPIGNHLTHSQPYPIHAQPLHAPRTLLPASEENARVSFRRPHEATPRMCAPEQAVSAKNQKSRHRSPRDSRVRDVILQLQPPIPYRCVHTHRVAPWRRGRDNPDEQATQRTHTHAHDNLHDAGTDGLEHGGSENKRPVSPEFPPVLTAGHR